MFDARLIVCKPPAIAIVRRREGVEVGRIIGARDGEVGGEESKEGGNGNTC